MPTSRPLHCLIVAGEVSGDLHAAALMQALRLQSACAWRFSGIGGDAMRAAGATLVYHTDQMGVMGAWEVLRRLRLLRGALNAMTARLRTERPDLLLTVDYPGFNLRLAARAKQLGIPTVQYISPKVWAWNRGRIPRMAEVIDHLLTVFPFETDVFAGTGLRVTYVGNPLVDRIRETREAPPVELPWGAGCRLALLPGSRTGEITRLLPDMLASAARLAKAIAQPVSGLVPAPTEAALALGQAMLDRQKLPSGVQLAFVRGQAHAVLLQARAALVASGTASLEACLLRCPTVIVYRVAWPTYCLGRLLIRGVDHIGLANIIAGQTVCPELIQGRFTPARAVQALAPLVAEGPARARMLQAMDGVNAKLGSGRADVAAAAAVLETLGV